MRVAIASDIHGNKHAFEAVIAAAQDAQVEELWCLGDLVGYGADPDACVALAEQHCAIILAGNHDLAVVDTLSLEDFSRGAALAAQWTKDVIRPATREFLLGLSPEGEAEGVGLYHASPRDPIWEYVLSALTAELCMESTERAGHEPHEQAALDEQLGHEDAALAAAKGAGLIKRSRAEVGSRLDRHRSGPGIPWPQQENRRLGKNESGHNGNGNTEARPHHQSVCRSHSSQTSTGTAPPSRP